MKIIITGATGMVGAEAVRQAVLDPAVEQITVLVRRPIDIQHPKITTVIHNDFLNYSGLENLFKNHDACLWCLGISQSQVSKEEYEVITFDYALAAAKAILQAHPDIVFLFVSGEGADSAEKSRTLFARVKGKTENALIKLGFKHLYIVRPGGIKPIHRSKNTPFLYKLFIPFFPVFELLMPSYIISSAELARVMLHVIKYGDHNRILENKYMKTLLKTANLMA